ncbi:unnamed protein product [Adineta ricciae]|uniref:Cytochrome P450 n=2 Tax=Adineta ricciae TaxID=249248 RepID=A0A815UXS5_ADIRI|nr:unnamed protein product [Adineta ricciae]
MLICLFVYYFRFLHYRYQYFHRCGISTPSFRFFFGHLKTLWNCASYHRQLESWTKQYGKIYGIYEGSLPIFVVSDADFLHEVFIKQFSVFHARKPTMLDNIFHDMFFSSGAKWRRQRQVISPTFSAAKLKTMSPLINRCINEFEKKLPRHAEDGEEFNIYFYYKTMTMDVICRCAFGIDTDVQNNPNNIYFRKVSEFFDTSAIDTNILYRSAQLMPIIETLLGRLFAVTNKALTVINTRLLPFISPTRQLSEVPITWLVNRVHTIVDQRQKIPILRPDLLNLMLETMNNASEDSRKSINQLTQEEVCGNIFVFMLAGYETTSTSLAYATYELARHPDVLQKLQSEIDQLLLENFDDDDDDEEIKKYPDYDIVSQMSYMDMFVTEVLRMYPIANRGIQRRAMEDTVIQGIKIEKGCVVCADVYSLHYDAELWGPEDPYVFYPERHKNKRHPMAYMPFGAGPRQCVGIRFALIEMKILLTRLLRHYTILPGEHIESKFIIQDRTVIAPDEIWIKLIRRNVEGAGVA